MGQPKSCFLALSAAVIVVTSVGCHSTSAMREDRGSDRAVAADRPSAAPGVGLPSPNAVLLAEANGTALEADEFSRNDHRMGAPTAGGFVLRTVDREWYQRDRIQAGRSYGDVRFTTRVRERSMPWRP